MRNGSMWMAGLLVGVLLAGGSRVLSQDKAPPDMHEMMQKWLKAMTPGENHKKLDYFIGNWEHTMKIWMAGPDAPPTETKGKSSAKWVLDGRFILGEVDGEMLMPDETGKMKSFPHRGLGLTGYDNYRNMYVGTWADNMGTTILNMAGGVDPSGKVFTSYGEMDEPMLDVRGRMVKYVTTIKDKDNYTFEIFDLHAGPNYKVLQIDYKRK